VQQVDITYVGEPPRTDRVAIHPVDEMRGKRELAGLKWADGEYRLYYHAWLASKRMGVIEEAMQFDLWLEGVVDLDPIITEKQITQALAAGAIDAEQAELMRAEMQRQGSGRGESPTPPTA
jgi:hypothetical protein